MKTKTQEQIKRSKMKMITKRQVGTIMRKLAKKHDFDYYSGYICCNSCFTSNLPEGRKYVYLKHCTKGMNYESSKDLHESNKWYFVYDLGKKSTKIFEEFKQEVEYKFENVYVDIPNSEYKCMVLVRWGGQNEL